MKRVWDSLTNTDVSEFAHKELELRSGMYGTLKPDDFQDYILDLFLTAEQAKWLLQHFSISNPLCLYVLKETIFFVQLSLSKVPLSHIFPFSLIWEAICFAGSCSLEATLYTRFNAAFSDGLSPVLYQ